MKKTILSVLLISLITSFSYSQIWDMQYASAYQLNDVIFSSQDYGVAVGTNGVVLYSSNGGYTWDVRPSNTIETLNSICYTDGGQTVYAVGSQGAIIKSSTSGQGWAPGTSGVTHALFAVDNMAGYVVAGGLSTTILKTTNGLDWLPQTSEVLCHISSLCFSDATTGFAVGNDGVLLRTTNSGNNWYQMNTGNITNHFTSICFPTYETGFAVGTGGLIIKTTNGFAQSYMHQSSNTLADLYDVFFVDELIGYIVGDGGTILKTINGGDNWINISYGTRLYKAVFFITPDIGWIVGQDGIILKTTSGGVNAIEEIENNGFSAYPNPVTDFMIVQNESGSEFTAQLADLTGSFLMESVSDAGKCKFDMCQLPGGIYFIKVKTDTNTFYLKCIKE